MIELGNKNIAVLGGGIEGVSSALYLQGKSAKVTLLDQKQLAEETRELLTSKGIILYEGADYLEKLAGYEMIVRSPGIKRNLPQLLQAEQQGTIITSQTKLFFDLCPSEIIGVTGTKGKGTTSSLIYHMLKKQGFDAYLGGNIGVPPFTFLDTVTVQSKVVLEMSSFQLQDLTKSPHIGVLLMMTSEHLDYHKDVYEYVEAKRNIIRFQSAADMAVLNRDYVASNESDIYTDGKVFYVSREREVEQGAYIQGKAVWLRMHGKEEKIIDTQDILLPGGHNLENVCAAVVAATLAGVKKEAIVTVLKTFKGLEHRLELVDTIRGVRYYDDSFSTTPETAIAAIEAFENPKILILGGSTKHSDFSQLGELIRKAKSIKAIIGIGLEWERIKEAIGEHTSPMLVIEGAKTMEQIVKAAEKLAKPGDVVLLSPACASFDMFKNYKDRGEQFKQQVRELEKS